MREIAEPSQTSQPLGAVAPPKAITRPGGSTAVVPEAVARSTQPLLSVGPLVFM